MSNNSVGQVDLDLNLNSKQFQNQLKNVKTQANSASQNIGSSFKKIGTAVVAAFSVKEIVSFGKECINLGSDLAEVQNVVDVTFTTMSDKVDKFAKDAINTSGLSETMAKQYAGTFGAMAKSFGFSEQSAYDMSTSLTTLAGDVASFYNLTQDEAYTKLKSVFTGETETLKDLGVVMTQTALDSYALANGYGKTTSAMTEAEKVALRYAFVQDQLSAASGDFIRTGDSWANQVRKLQTNFDALKATLGQAFIQVLTPVIRVINQLIGKLQQAAEIFSAFITEIFGGDSGAAGATASAFADASSALDSSSGTAADNLSSAADSAKEIKNNLASFDKLNILDTSAGSSSSESSTAPSDLPVSSTVSLDLDTSSVEKSISSNFKKIFKDLYKKSGAQDFVNQIKKGFEGIDFGGIKKNFTSIFENLKPIAKSTFSGMLKVGKSALNSLGTYIGGEVKIIGKSLQTVSGGIAQWLEKDGEKISNWVTDTAESISNGFDNLSNFFESVFNTIGKSIDEMRPTVESAISDLLSGISNYCMSIGTVFTDGFEIATISISDWATENETTISEFCKNIQSTFADVSTTIGTIFDDIGNTISEWWNGKDGGKNIFQNVCDMFTNIGTTLMNVYNEWIKPVIDFIVGVAQDAWNNCLKPIFDSLVSFFGKIADFISTLWNNILSPLVNWFIDRMSPIITNVLNVIRGVFSTVFGWIGGLISGLLKSLGGLLDFITGVFSGNWEKAWNGIKDFIGGIWDMIWSSIKATINLIIDGINGLWSGIYTAIQGLVNGIGSIAGAIGDLLGKDWKFSMPEEPPLIPKLATGGLVTAPTLALVGDNKNASVDPEVVAPLSKLKNIINDEKNSSNTDVQVVLLLTKAISLLEKILDKVNIISVQDDGDIVINIDGEEVFRVVRDKNNKFKKRHGKSAFA